MPSVILREPEQDTVTIASSGLCTLSTLLSHLHEYRLSNPSACLVRDPDKVDLIAFTTEDILLVLALVMRFEETGRWGKTALIAGHDLGIGLAGVAESHGESVGVDKRGVSIRRRSRCLDTVERLVPTALTVRPMMGESIPRTITPGTDWEKAFYRT